MPNHIFFDNNCSLAKHVKNDLEFKDVGLSVDIFHFNCKHSQKDVFCQMNCNPALFLELLSDDGILILQLRSRQMFGWVVFMQLFVKCWWTGIISSWMKWLFYEIRWPMQSRWERDTVQCIERDNYYSINWVKQQINIEILSLLHTVLYREFQAMNTNQ